MDNITTESELREAVARFSEKYHGVMNLTTTRDYMNELVTILKSDSGDVKDKLIDVSLKYGPFPNWFRPGIFKQAMIDSHLMDDMIEEFATLYECIYLS